MSQENSTSEKTNEARKKVALGVLLLVLAGVVYFQFISGSGAPSPTPGLASVTTRPSPSPTPPRQTPQRGGTPEQIISQPLDLASIVGRPTSTSSGTGRNIFVYPTPTPLPPTPPPTPTPTPVPPPITIFSINPGGVIARTGDFTLTVFGAKIPQDAQGFLNGVTYPTTFVSDKEAKIKVPGDAIRAPGNFSVTIRSQNNSQLYSNPYSLNVAQPQDPPYKYIGLIAGKNSSTAVLKSSNDDDIHNVKKGDVVDRRWKIVRITTDKIEIEDITVKLDRPHTINYSGEAR
jgi:hypothetical protein